MNTLFKNNEKELFNSQLLFLKLTGKGFVKLMFQFLNKKALYSLNSLNYEL